ncbi:transcriptional regulator [Capnocytophaga cynodegmi]|uniref:transcriptional regulator n=1 Tax=Capnocytophaga cynodegmi TaxID=28189 RepID=UPI0037D25E1A
MARMTKEEQRQKQEHAKLLYTKENITTQRELAERVGVTEKTISQWIEQGQWEKLKQNLIVTRQEQHANMLAELERLNEHVKTLDKGFVNSQLASIRRQLIKDIKDLESEAVGLSEIISVQVDFLDYVRKTDPKQALSVAGLVDLFIKSKL